MKTITILLITTILLIFTSCKKEIPKPVTIINPDFLIGKQRKIPTGEGIKGPIDGLATSKYTTHVYKIPGKIFHPGARIEPGGDIRLKWDILSTAEYNAKIVIDPDYTFGWKRLSELDNNWARLFELAKLINK